MARVFFVHPAFPSKYPGLPLGLVSVATAVRDAGHEVYVLDLQATQESDAFLHTLVSSSPPDVVGVASTSPSHLAACRLAQYVKTFLPQTIVVKGGTHETYCAETTLAHHPEIDYSVRGPGEETMVELLDVLNSAGDLSSVAGLGFRDTAGQVCLTSSRALASDLDNYPLPDRSLLPASATYDFSIFSGRRTTQSRMSRGCSYGCTFCPIDRTYKFHSASFVLRDLEALTQQGYRAVFWDDAILTAKPSLLREIFSGASDRSLPLVFGGQTRADVHVDAPLLDLLQERGLVYLSFGLESGDPVVLQQYNKRLRIEEVSRAVALCKERGITVSLTCIVGSAHERPDSLAKTVDLLNRLHPDAVSFSVHSFYPGSSETFDPLWYENPRLSADHPAWLHFDEGAGAQHPPHVTVDYLDSVNAYLCNHLDSTILR